MSSLSSGKLNDIKYLYENVVSGNQEVLGELNEASNDPSLQQAKGFIKGTGDVLRSAFIDDPKAKPTTKPASTPAKPTSTGTPTSTDYKSKFARPQNAAPGIGNPSGKDSRLDSPTAGRGPKGNEVGSNLHPFKAASGTTPGAAGGGSAPGAKAAPARPVLSKQGGVEGTGTGANFKAGAWSSAEKSRYSAQAAKTTPAASAQNPAIGKLGNTSFVRKTPTSDQLSAAQAARAGGANPEQALQAAQKTNLPTTGPANASIDKSSVQASLARANSPASSAATPGVGQRAAAMPSMGSSQYKATTPSAAIAAAPSTSATASGSVTPATNKIAAMNKQPEVKPQATISASYEYDTYDLVLEYLLDSGHAESIAEAQYIMTEMDQESIAEIAESQKPLPRNKMWNQIMNKPNKTGENLYSKNNRKMHSVIKAHDADPEGEAAKAKEKSKYKG